MNQVSDIPKQYLGQISNSDPSIIGRIPLLLLQILPSCSWCSVFWNLASCRALSLALSFFAPAGPYLGQTYSFLGNVEHNLRWENMWNGLFGTMYCEILQIVRHPALSPAMPFLHLWDPTLAKPSRATPTVFATLWVPTIYSSHLACVQTCHLQVMPSAVRWIQILAIKAVSNLKTKDMNWLGKGSEKNGIFYGLLPNRGAGGQRG